MQQLEFTAAVIELVEDTYNVLFPFTIEFVSHGDLFEGEVSIEISNLKYATLKYYYKLNGEMSAYLINDEGTEIAEYNCEEGTITQKHTGEEL